MKKNILISVASVLVVAALIVYGCQKDSRKDNSSNANQRLPKNSEVPISSLPVGTPKLKAAPLVTYTCGSVMSGDYSGVGYYEYPSYPLDVSAVDTGGTISIEVQSFDVPNRFTVYDVNNNEVAYTNWMGHVNYSGPWGQSLNTSETATLQFIRGVSSSYSLVVETVTQSNSDSWNASMSCAYVPNIQTIKLTDVGTKNTMVAAFKNLADNMSTLGTDLGLGHSLSLSDLDTTQIYETYDANEYDSGVAITIAFANNSNSNTYNYGFTMYMLDSTYILPMITESETGSNIYLYDLNNNLVTTIANYNSSNVAITQANGNFGTGGPGCGQKVANCMLDAYSNHGWISVWVQIQTAYIPETIGAFAAACAIKNCL